MLVRKTSNWFCFFRNCHWSNIVAPTLQSSKHFSDLNSHCSQVWYLIPTVFLLYFICNITLWNNDYIFILIIAYFFGPPKLMLGRQRLAHWWTECPPMWQVLFQKLLRYELWKIWRTTKWQLYGSFLQENELPRLGQINFSKYEAIPIGLNQFQSASNKPLKS